MNFTVPLFQPKLVLNYLSQFALQNHFFFRFNLRYIFLSVKRDLNFTVPPFQPKVLVLNCLSKFALQNYFVLRFNLIYMTEHILNAQSIPISTERTKDIRETRPGSRCGNTPTTTSTLLEGWKRPRRILSRRTKISHRQRNNSEQQGWTSFIISDVFPLPTFVSCSMDSRWFLLDTGYFSVLELWNIYIFLLSRISLYEMCLLHVFWEIRFPPLFFISPPQFSNHFKGFINFNERWILAKEIVF